MTGMTSCKSAILYTIADVLCTHTHVGPTHLQQHSAVGVHVGPGVLGLPVFSEYFRGDLEQLTHQGEEWVVRQVLLSKLPLTHVPRVSLA